MRLSLTPLVAEGLLVALCSLQRLTLDVDKMHSFTHTLPHLHTLGLWIDKFEHLAAILASVSRCISAFFPSARVLGIAAQDILDWLPSMQTRLETLYVYPDGLYDALKRNGACKSNAWVQIVWQPDGWDGFWELLMQRPFPGEIVDA